MAGSVASALRSGRCPQEREDLSLAAATITQVAAWLLEVGVEEDQTDNAFDTGSAYAELALAARLVREVAGIKADE